MEQNHCGHLGFLIDTILAFWCRLKILYFLALAAILLNGAEPLRPSWIFDWHNFSFLMSFEDFVFFLALAAILFNGAEPLWPSWIFIQHNFSSFRSRSHPVAKEQVLAQNDLRFEKRCRKLIFKMAAVVAILNFLSALAILCLISTLMLIIKFWFNWII